MIGPLSAVPLAPEQVFLPPGGPVALKARVVDPHAHNGFYVHLNHMRGGARTEQMIIANSAGP